MTEKFWIDTKEGSKENTPSTKMVLKSGLEELRGVAVDSQQRLTTSISYGLNGVWKGTFKVYNTDYDTLSVPRAGVITSEGLPEIPQEGIFVAVPNGATNFEVKVIQKKMQPIPGAWQLKPAPKPVVEMEYLEGREEYKPKKEVYDSDTEFPGKDFEFLGLKQLEGVPVVHLIVYLAQYKPLSKSLSVVETMEIEISYDVPPQTDAVPRTRSISPMLSDLILDSDNINELTIGDNEPVDATDTLKRANIISQYVIITTPALTEAVQPLLNAKLGLNAMIATTQAIISEFPAGNLKDSIKNFLSWARSNWRVPPQFVVLAGDVDSIPVHTYTQYTIPGEHPEHPISDHYYADILNDLSPEIVVSRIPTSDAATMLQICNNLAQYASHRGSDRSGWQNQVLLVAYQRDDYKACSDDIANDISQRFEITKLYGDDSSRQQVIDKMNAGVLVANYRGHGEKTGWTSANGLSTADIKALNNGSMPPMVFCICCQNAWIDDQATEVVVETFLREGKCVSVLGASRNSYTRPNDNFNKYLWQAVLDHGEVTPGGIVQRAKVMMIMNFGNDTAYQTNVVVYMLFGDPTAVIFSTA